MTSQSVFRATVRGHFVDLSASARATLTREVAHHDIFVSAFTAEGTFTYDEKILFFNLRYEIRNAANEVEAAERARSEAEMFLGTMGFGHSALKVTVADMSSIWKHPR